MPHIHEKIDFTVEIYIVYKNKVLLRMHEKYGMWFGVGGHIELDEDPNQAAVRESKEECGLDIELYKPQDVLNINSAKYKELIPPAFMNRYRLTDTHEHITLIYFGKSYSDQLNPGADEVETVFKWLTISEIEIMQELKDDVKHYAITALKLLGK